MVLITRAVAAILCMTPGQGNAQVQLPDMGDSSATVISAADEKRLGEAFMREIRASLSVIDDPEVEDYIQALGYSLVTHSGAESAGFTFFVLGHDAINAFAAPGGFVGVNSGLIQVTESESELASVMAHEIAHVTQRHIARAIEHADRSNLPALAGIIAAVIIGMQNAQAGRATAAAVIGSAVQKSLDFTRQNEKEADRVGIQLLADSDFDPRAMPVFFERLQGSARYSRRPPEFLSTHPVTTSRIADSRDRAERFPYRQYTDSFAYHLVRAKLRVVTAEDPKDLLVRLEDEIAERRYRNLPATVYARALALGAAGRPREARDELARLVEAFPRRMSFRAALADSELRTGDADKALEIYSNALDVFPDNRVLVRGYAVALLEIGRAEAALALIQDYARLYTVDGALHRLLAQAHEKLGNPADSQAALAEHYYLGGQLDAAIHQLRLATRHPDKDFYRSSRFEARLKEFEDEKALRMQR